jgi:hypothetical protein
MQVNRRELGLAACELQCAKKIKFCVGSTKVCLETIHARMPERPERPERPRYISAIGMQVDGAGLGPCEDPAAFVLEAAQNCGQDSECASAWKVAQNLELGCDVVSVS